MNQTRLLKYGAAVLKDKKTKHINIIHCLCYAQHQHSLIANELQHTAVVHFIHIQRNCPDRDADH